MPGPNVTKIGIVYSKGKAHVRRHVVPDDSDAELDKHPLHPGEAMCHVPVEAFHGGHASFHPARDAAVAASAGIPVGNSRCAVIDSNNIVVNVIMADDSIDAVDGHTLVNHSSVYQGCVYNPEKKNFSTPSYVLPAKAGVRSVPTVIPSQTI